MENWEGKRAEIVPLQIAVRASLGVSHSVHVLSPQQAMSRFS